MQSLRLLAFAFFIFTHLRCREVRAKLSWTGTIKTIDPAWRSSITTRKDNIFDRETTKENFALFSGASNGNNNVDDNNGANDGVHSAFGSKDSVHDMERRMLMDFLGYPDRLKKKEKTALERQFVETYNELSGDLSDGLPLYKVEKVKFQRRIEGEIEDHRGLRRGSTPREFTWLINVVGSCTGCSEDTTFFDSKNYRVLKAMGATFALDSTEPDDKENEKVVDARESARLSQCEACKPTNMVFEKAYDSDLQLLRQDDVVKNVVEMIQVTELDEIPCSEEVEYFETNVQVGFVGALESVKPDEEEALEIEFVSTYNSLARQSCDPFFRTIESAKIVDSFFGYGRYLQQDDDAPFTYIFRVRARCRGCPNDDLFSDIGDRRNLLQATMSAIRDRSLKSDYICFCDVNAVVDRAPTEEEFTTSYNDAVVALDLPNVESVTFTEQERPDPPPTPAPFIQPTLQPSPTPVSPPKQDIGLPPYVPPSYSSPPRPSPGHGTANPTAIPTGRSNAPTSSPTSNPTRNPTTSPTVNLTSSPTKSPTSNPTTSPTLNPTESQTVNPTSSPTRSPTTNPTASPTMNPTTNPTLNPTESQSVNPTSSPTRSPTTNPTASPSMNPTTSSTSNPTGSPTSNSTTRPTAMPTKNPTAAPTLVSEPTTNVTTPAPTPSASTVPPVSEPTLLPSAAPSQSLAPTSSLVPTAGPTSRSREAIFFDLLSPITPVELLNDTSTPQGQAFNWIVNEDLLQVDPLTYETVEQRYALATLFYATAGQSWFDNTGWLGAIGECNWFGVLCEGSFVDALGLGLNDLNGTIPNEIQVFDQIRTLSLFGNLLSSTLPSTISNLTNLLLLDVEENLLEGTLFTDDILSLRNLVGLRASFNRFIGTIAPEISQFASLEQLWLAENSLDGEIPSEIGQLQNLESLFLYTNDIAGPIPSTIGNAQSLSLILLYDTLLNGTIPEELYDLSNLQVLQLHANRLSGTISPNVGNLVRLVDVRFDQNSFQNSIPSDIDRLSNLIFFQVNDNQLTGTLPDDVFQAYESLEFIDTSNNELGGPIPSSLFEIQNISFVYLSNNTFNESIPSNYGDAVFLEDLYLDGNQLTGNVPEIASGQLGFLTELLVHRNDLTGSMPASVCALRSQDTGRLDDLWSDCGGDPPEFQCDFPDCCNRCFVDS